jgi:hypothetical protein
MHCRLSRSSIFGSSLFKFNAKLGERQESNVKVQLCSDTHQTFERHRVVKAADANTCHRTCSFIGDG